MISRQLIEIYAYRALMSSDSVVAPRPSPSPDQETRLNSSRVEPPGSDGFDGNSVHTPLSPQTSAWLVRAGVLRVVVPGPSAQVAVRTQRCRTDLAACGG